MARQRLWNGKVGCQRPTVSVVAAHHHSLPGGLAQVSPHTMHEDRAILESVLAKNRNAIVDLHSFTSSTHGDVCRCQPSPSKGSSRRHKSSSPHYSGPDIPPMSDIFTTTRTAEKVSPLKRPFSKKGFRLGVHMSILDLGAHDAPDRLKDKWI